MRTVLLWDYEMASEKDSLEGMQPNRRLALAVAAIDWTLETMGPIETDEVRTYLEEGMRAARAAVQNGSSKVELTEETLDQYESVDEVADEPGTSHMLSALLACCDIPEQLGAEELYGVLSFCYEGSLDREDVPEWSSEAERENARCLEVIAFQKDLISRMAA
ncbi:hypothetical protein ACISU4_20165 [Streptomyces wuyuanensis]|uniref:hypothetical protein n=1 Tax=Streptomyces wuyuanensis TaxID=1196353 RepID=UPI00380098E2